MATTNIYLNFDGNCEEAFNFYKSVFGSEFSYFSRFGDMPASESSKVNDNLKDLIMHVSIPVGTSTLMGSDVGEEWAPSLVKGNNFSVSVTAETKAEADHIFNGLAAGGNVTMPLNDTFWGEYFGMLTDRFGINWMVSFADPSREK